MPSEENNRIVIDEAGDVTLDTLRTASQLLNDSHFASGFAAAIGKSKIAQSIEETRKKNKEARRKLYPLNNIPNLSQIRLNISTEHIRELEHKNLVNNDTRKTYSFIIKDDELICDNYVAGGLSEVRPADIFKGLALNKEVLLKPLFEDINNTKFKVKSDLRLFFLALMDYVEIINISYYLNSPNPYLNRHKDLIYTSEEFVDAYYEDLNDVINYSYEVIKQCQEQKLNL